MKPKRIRWTEDSFTAKLVEVHNGAYDYSQIGFQTSNERIKVLCHRHGEPFLFTPIASDHLRGSGCPKCYDDQRSEKVRLGKGRDQEWFLAKVLQVHGDTYDLSRAVFKGYHSKVEIGCRKEGHGFWSPLAGNFLKGSSCPVCAREANAVKRQLSLEEFLSKASEVHPGKYTYLNAVYSGAKTPVSITCPDHGEFSQTPMDHLQGHGCQRCGKIDSQPVKDLKCFLEEQEIELEKEKLLSSGQRLDLYCSKLNLGLEYNGLLWHSDAYQLDRLYHLKKSEAAKKDGIHLIHVFEDDWLFQNDRTKTWLLSQFGIYQKRQYARSLRCEPISWREAKTFLDQVHMQGSGAACDICYGLVSKESSLQAVMTFSGKNRNRGEVELERFAALGQIPGGFSKLLSGFLRDHGGHYFRIVSFSDKAWSEGRVYSANGFTHDGITPPRYWWVKGQRRYHRRYMQRQFLPERLTTFDPALSEDENCRVNGYSKLYDCGLDRWVLNLK